MTVSLALRDSTEIGLPVRQRVHEVATELGYDPMLTVAARRLGNRRYGGTVSNHVAGVLLPAGSLEFPYFNRLYTGVVSALEKRFYATLTVACNLTPLNNSLPFAPLVRGEIDGLIVLADPVTIPQIEALRTHVGLRECPAVALMHHIPGWGSVTTDDTAGTTGAANRLLDLGHRHFLRLAYVPISDAEERGDSAMRRKALCGALAARALTPADHIVTRTCPPKWMTPAAARQRLRATEADAADQALLAVLASHPEITAILCGNDAIAIHAYGALRRAGLTVPGRYSLVGFDDTDPIPDANGDNFLSSVALPLEEAGRNAGEMVWAAAQQNAPLADLVLPARFVPRASIGPVPG